MDKFIEILKIVPSGFWFTLLTVVSTLIGIWLTNKSNYDRLTFQLENEKKTKSVELLKDRFEELYMLANEFFKVSQIYFLPYIKAMKEEISINQALDFTIQNPVTIKFERIQMIICLYYPDLLVEFEKFRDSFQEAYEIVQGFKISCKTGGSDSQKSLKTLNLSLQKLSDQKQKVIEQMTLEAKKLRTNLIVSES